MSSIRDQLSSYGKSTGPRAKGFRLGATVDTSQMSALGCGGKCCKYALMGLTIFLTVCGIGVLAGGAYCGQNVEVVQAIGSSFTNCILAFGIILLLIGAIGLVGSKTESRLVLGIFLLLMGLMMLVLLIFGAWALSNLGKEGVILAAAWTNLSTDSKVHIENAYPCCGAYYWGEATDTTTCPCQKSACGGCFPLLITDFRALYTSFGVIFIIVAVVMLAGLITAFFLLKGIASAEESKSGGKGKGGKGKGRG